ncbi:hypothetical protein BC941DRAFT_457995 [Chlamydoabsidia padenii]|nr:hypothetical protein BC941DRAFT_457995 [Chlamydoabsidia padenii]
MKQNGENGDRLRNDIITKSRYKYLNGMGREKFDEKVMASSGDICINGGGGQDYIKHVQTILLDVIFVKHLGANTSRESRSRLGAPVLVWLLLRKLVFAGGCGMLVRVINDLCVTRDLMKNSSRCLVLHQWHHLSPWSVSNTPALLRTITLTHGNIICDSGLDGLVYRFNWICILRVIISDRTSNLTFVTNSTTNKANYSKCSDGN